MRRNDARVIAPSTKPNSETNAKRIRHFAFIFAEKLATPFMELQRVGPLRPNSDKKVIQKFKTSKNRSKRLSLNPVWTFSRMTSAPDSRVMVNVELTPRRRTLHSEFVCKFLWRRMMGVRANTTFFLEKRVDIAMSRKLDDPCTGFIRSQNHV